MDATPAFDESRIITCFTSFQRPSSGWSSTPIFNKGRTLVIAMTISFRKPREGDAFAGDRQEVLALYTEPRSPDDFLSVALELYGDLSDGLDGSEVKIESPGNEDTYCEDYFIFDAKEHHYMLEFTSGMVTLYRDGARFSALSHIMSPRQASYQSCLSVCDEGADQSTMIRYISSIQMYFTPVARQIGIGKKRSLHNEGDGVDSKLRAMWDDRKFTDAKVRCDGREFHVHRAIVSVSSPVLEAMFTTEAMKEGSERAVTLNNVPANIVEACLRFMYDGTVPTDMDVNLQLLALADQYQVPLLVELCCENLVDAFNYKTVVPILRVLQPRRHIAKVDHVCKILTLRLQTDKHCLESLMNVVR